MHAHLLLGMHVGKDIGATEGINRLLRIADHVETAFGISFIQCRENLILQRVGILKFIDHRDRIKLADLLSQCLPALTLQRPSQIGQQVIKRELLFALFLLLQPLTNRGQRLRQHNVINIAGFCQQRINLPEERMRRHRTRFTLFCHFLTGKTRDLFFRKGISLLRRTGPSGNGFNPFRHIILAVTLFFQIRICNQCLQCR